MAVEYMPRTVSSPGLKRHGFCGRRGFQEGHPTAHALGEGLDYPLKSFVVSLSLDESPAILNVDGDSAKCTQWQVFSPTVAAGYICAIVVHGEHWQLSNMGVFRAPS